MTLAGCCWLLTRRSSKERYYVCISSFRPPQGRLFEAAQHGDWRPWLRLRGRGRRTAPSSQPMRAGCPWRPLQKMLTWGEISRRNRSTSSR
ncbi:unnamed protein product [Pelagomonas calceolata]|uniref:Uncharacterized protein n=1 Tax=Pelagomonas calceolata TaxID=35677 RepID=A0A8J2SBX2_9STRA|nr:unnamed protein product [Pelagomonas calceolata]